MVHGTQGTTPSLAEGVKTGVMYREVDIQDWLKRNVVPVVRCGS